MLVAFHDHLQDNMKENIQAAQQYLGWVQHSDGGWPYQVEAQSYPEPTCYSLLALSARGWRNNKEIQHRALDWLAAHVNSHGALTLDGDDEPHWSTSLLVLTLSRLQQSDGRGKTHPSAIRHPPSAIREQGVRWLLSWQGNPLEPNKEIPLNGQLRGWPWTSDTFSWVEPTSYAVLALKLSGHSDHPRVAEAEALLLDRVCVGGGWNYGNRIVFGRALPAFLPQTAMAALALQGVPAAHQLIDQSLAFLRREVSQNQSALALALTILCFNAFGQPADEFVHALLKRQKPDGSWRQATHLTALAILALDCVTGGSNVFKV